MGFLQMTAAALGSFACRAAARQPLGLIAVVGGLIALAFASGIFGVMRAAGGPSWRMATLRGGGALAPASEHPPQN